MRGRLPDTRVRIITIILIVVSSVLVYSFSLRSQFQFDDAIVVMDNSSIHSLKTAITDCPSSRPIFNLTFALNYKFSKRDTFSYHVTNLIFHILTCILLFFVVEFILKLPLLKDRFGNFALEIALFTALIFTLHPLHTESVIYLTSRSVPMASIFYLGTILLFLLVVYRPHLLIPCAITALIFGVIGMGIRETMVTCPFIILLFDYMLVAKMDLKELKKRWPFHAFTFSSLLAMVYVVIRWGGHAYGKTSGFGIPHITPLDYLFTQFTVLFHYIKLIFFPFPLILDYDWPVAKSLFEFPTIISFLALIGVFILIIKLFKKRPFYSFLIIWYFVNISPASSFIPLKDVVFEHRAYLPSIGIIWLVLLGVVPCLGSKSVPVRYLCITSLSIFFLVFGWLNIQRNITWQTEISLWQDTLNKSPNKARVQHNLGKAYQNVGMLDNALNYYNNAIALDPYHLKAYYHLGTVYVKRGQLDKAKQNFQIAVEIDPEYVIAHNNLGIIYLKEGLLGKAIAHFKRAIRIHPNSLNAHYNLGMVYEDLGYLEKAKFHYEKTIQIDPTFKAGYHSLRMIRVIQEKMR